MNVPNDGTGGGNGCECATNRYEHADELARLREDCAAMAAVLMGPKVFVHESIVAEVDQLLTRHLGGYMGTPAIA